MCSKSLKNEKIKEQLAYLPTSSGCYLYHDKNDEIIYVGKAKNLKRRVSSYFNKNHTSAKTTTEATLSSISVPRFT